MGIKRNRKRLVAAAIALAGLAGGAVAAHATNFAWQRRSSDGAGELPVDRPDVHDQSVCHRPQRGSRIGRGR